MDWDILGGSLDIIQNEDTNGQRSVGPLLISAWVIYIELDVSY